MNKFSHSHRFCIAPMLDWTDRHYRYLARRFTRQSRLYTEMVTSDALLHGDREYLLGFHDCEHPVALQVGGCRPDDMQRCAEIGQAYGYDEININAGCPSDRVQSGQFGACLMMEPERIAACIKPMRQNVDIPVTVKTRLGVDEFDSVEFLRRFLDEVTEAGCDTIILHARKAWLSGLSPKENREIPPLNYDRVYLMKETYPHINFVINGGITQLDEVEEHLKHVDGVMLGREAYKNPLLLMEVDQRIFHATSEPLSIEEEIQHYVEYMVEQMERGVPLKAMAKPLLGLFQGMPGVKKWRRYLSEHMHHPGTQPEFVLQALEYVTPSATDMVA